MAESDVTTVGGRVWLVNGSNADEWTPAVVEQCDGVEVVYKSDYGEEHRKWVSEVTSAEVKPMNGLLLEGVPDMAKMTELNQASILCNLNTRYQNNDIYTYIGSILISVNPYKRLHDLYSDQVLTKYKNKDLGDEPPHVYAISNECYTCMWKREENQCVLISGESGAGKTETTKFMLSYLSHVSKASGKTEPSKENGRSIEQSILESSPLLEALGNAKTVYNNNSSRFGKFIQLLFSEAGQIKGARITDYLLEKHRVVRQNPGERNYHIFYQLVRGLSQDEREKLHLREPSEYHYLNQSGCDSDPTLDDVKDWEQFEQSLVTIGFKDGQREDMKSVLAGILQLGNVAFANAGGAQVVEMDVVDQTSQLLGIDSERLEAVMKEKTMKLRGENITSPQSVDQACDSRDSLSMALYSQLFRWIISRVNHRIKGPDDFHFIGILDIFGFENFAVNRFEQFCINFANEKLQEFFNRHIFSLEQIEYNKEGIDWCDVQWSDNSECLDLVEKNLGLISLINEESRFPKGTDKSLLQKLHSQHAKNAFYVKPRVTGNKFGIKHYAGEVLYDIDGFLEKNRDTFRDDLLGLLKDSSCDLIYDMFEKVRGNSEDSGKARKKQSAVTASGHFKKSLHALMERLSSASPFFVRCVKPNLEKVPENFNPGIVLNQLRYSGMLETVRVRKAGFPVRRPYKDFLDRYGMICALASDKEPRDHSKEVLNQVDPEGTNWRLGHTKAFVKEILEQKLEKARFEKVSGAVIIIQSVMRAVAARKYFLRLKSSCVHAQRFVRGFVARRKFKRAYKAILTMQKFERGRKARKLFQVLLAEKRERERKRVEATIVLQKYTRGRAARKMFKVLLEKHRQLKALKEQMERERKQREEQARLERERLAREAEERKRKEQEERERMAREAELAKEAAAVDQEQNNALPSPPPPPPLSPPAEEFATQRKSIDGEHASALASLDAVIDSADIDSAYSTVNKRTFSNTGEEEEEVEMELNEAEQEEMERIFQLELEIAQMHRQSEARSSLALEVEPEPMEEYVTNQTGDYYADEKADEHRAMDILQDLGFEDFESQVDAMMHDTAYDVSGVDQMDESKDIVQPDVTKKVDEVAETGGSTSDMDDESYYTDSSFDDDDDISDDGTSNSGGMEVADKWNPNVYFHSYLDIKGGLMGQWKRRWCVLSNSTFMFFRSKQDSLKCGWLFKKADGGKGTLRGTLPRKNWQKKWFTLRNKEIKYYDNDEENAKCRGTIDLGQISDVTDVTEKENGIDVIMSNSKIHHLSAESSEEAGEWYSILMKMMSSSEKEIANMESEFANPKNALMTVDGQTITQVTATSVSGKSNTFTVTTSQRVYTFASDSVEEMHHWITLLNESKNTAISGDSVGQDSFIQQGWMLKTSYEKQRVSHQRRWFVLKPSAIEYYKTSNRGAPKIGSMGLNSLCVVTLPDEAVFKQTGLWEIVVCGRKHALRLSTEVEEDANIWSSEIQAMIDGQPQIVTKTKVLMDKVKNAHDSEKEIDLIYKRNPIFRQTNQPLRSPLLSLPYEQVPSRDDHYTLRDEAVRIFNVLLQMEEQTFGNMREEAQALQAILRACHGSKLFQDELYLQLIKQTAVYTLQLTTEEQMGDQLHVTSCPHYWHLIACMCCAYHPSRPVMAYLKTHLARVQERFPETLGAAYAEFGENALSQQTSRRREMVPSIAEICAVLEMRDLVTVINCYGGATCDIYINSFTTAGKVVQKLRHGMHVEGNRNTFALFEHRGQVDRAIEPSTYLADVVAKFEQMNLELQASPDNGGKESEWVFYFKLYCVFDPIDSQEDSIEYHFVYEDVHEQVIQGLYPASDDVLRDFAALRLQFAEGNYHQINIDTEIGKYYPLNKLLSAYDITHENEDFYFKRTDSFGDANANATPSKKRSGSSLFNTFRKRGMKKVKEEAESDDMKRTLFLEELQDVKSNVLDRWRRLKGMHAEEAVVEYVNLARRWPGYGSYLFKVKNHDAQFGQTLLSLAVSAQGATVFKRGHPQSLDHFSYEKIQSFGASTANVFRLQTESRGDISFTAEQVNEIVKLMRAYVNALYRRKH